MMLVPTLLYGANMLGRAPIFEGDVRKEMTCISCDGLGRSAEKESCDTCRGRGVAEFILPGPNRPIQLIGTVRDSAGDTVEGADVATKQAEGDDTELLLKTNGDGQFGIKLPPGNYVIKISKDGSGSVEETLNMKANPDPLPARTLDTLHKLEQKFILAK